MAERDPWHSLQIPDKYTKLDNHSKKEFLVGGIETLAEEIKALGLPLSGNVRLIANEVTEKQDENAATGLEYLQDLFIGGFIENRVTEDDREVVVDFLNKLNKYLDEKYSSPTLLDRIKKLLAKM